MTIKEFKNNILPLKNKLFRLAHKVLGDPGEAQDVTQEVLIKMWNMGSDIQHIENQEAFGMRMAKNLSIDKLRSKHRRIESINEAIHLEDASQSPLQSTVMNDTINHLKKLMEKLPEKQKTVLHLRDIEGFSYQEIGEIMEIPLNQVKVNLFRARQNLKSRMLKLKLV